MRHYLPGVGRFVSRVHLHEAVAMGRTTYQELRDEWGINIGPLGTLEAFARNERMEHSYAYCGNDPVNWVDPAGYQKMNPGATPKPKPAFPDLPRDWKDCLSDAVGGNIIFGKTPGERLEWKKIARCIIWAESHDNPRAKNPTSSARALMQILKSHDKACTQLLGHCFDPFNAYDNIRCGVMILADAVRRGTVQDVYTSTRPSKRGKHRRLTPYEKCMRDYEW